jgi:CBS-domain-containing membrane protein
VFGSLAAKAGEFPNVHIFSQNIKGNLRPFLIQSLLATATILVILLFLDVLTHTAIIACLGSSAFLIFTRPRAYAARPRPFIGGYLVSMVIGVFYSYATHLPDALQLPVSAATVFVVFSAMAVGGAIFIMVITDTEHPPAAGLALGLVLNSWDYRTLAFILGAVLLMAMLRHLLRNYMIDVV